METLVTNLSENLTIDELKALYWKRWGIETSYRTAKRQLYGTDFMSRKVTGIINEIYAMFMARNMVIIVTEDALEQMAIEKKKDGTDYKHRMVINGNYAIGIVKTRLLEFMFAPQEKKAKITEEIINEIASHIEPVRPGRQFKRTKRKTEATMSYKRSF